MFSTTAHGAWPQNDSNASRYHKTDISIAITKSINIHQFAKWQIKINLNENFLSENLFSSILFLLPSCGWISVATMNWNVIGNSLISLRYRGNFHFAFPHSITWREQHNVERFVICFDYSSMNFLLVSEIAQLTCAQLSHNFGADEW